MCVHRVAPHFVIVVRVSRALRVGRVTKVACFKSIMAGAAPPRAAGLVLDHPVDTGVDRLVSEGADGFKPKPHVEVGVSTALHGDRFAQETRVGVGGITPDRVGNIYVLVILHGRRRPTPGMQVVAGAADEAAAGKLVCAARDPVVDVGRILDRAALVALNEPPDVVAGGHVFKLTGINHPVAVSINKLLYKAAGC